MLKEILPSELNHVAIVLSSDAVVKRYADWYGFIITPVTKSECALTKLSSLIVYPAGNNELFSTTCENLT